MMPATDGATRADLMVVSMARQIADGATVATGLLSWLPMLAIALARATHAPGLTYLNCAGAIDPPVRSLPRSSTDCSLLRDNPYCLRLTDLWDFAARGRLDVMFFGFAQIDRNKNTNLSLLCRANGQRHKLAGVAGAFALRQLVRQPVLFSPHHAPSVFVPRVDAVTTVGGQGSVRVVTNLGVFDLAKGKLHIVRLHPSCTVDEVRAQTAFPVQPPRRLRYTSGPSPREWRVLQKLDPGKIRSRYLDR